MAEEKSVSPEKTAEQLQEALNQMTTERDGLKIQVARLQKEISEKLIAILKIFTKHSIPHTADGLDRHLQDLAAEKDALRADRNNAWDELDARRKKPAKAENDKTDQDVKEPPPLPLIDDQERATALVQLDE